MALSTLHPNESQARDSFEVDDTFWFASVGGQSVPLTVSGNLIAGVCNVEGWGNSEPSTLRDAGIRWGREDLSINNLTNVRSAGFECVAICGNSADTTVITTLTDTQQGAQAVSEVASQPQALVLEFMNEPWLKGSEAHPVKYGRMYMSALSQLRAAGVMVPLLFASTGSVNFASQSYSCTTTSGSPVVTVNATTGTDELCIGMAISGTGIPSGSWIQSFNSDGVHFTIGNNSSANATVSGTNTIAFTGRFSPPSDGDNPAQAGWLGRACATVPGLAAAILNNGICLHPYGMPTEDSSGHAQGIASVAWNVANHYSLVLGAQPQLWITEFGYYIDGSTSGATTGTRVFDETEQALRVGQALDALAAIPSVKGAFVFTGVDTNWGVIRQISPYNQARPALAEVVKRNVSTVNLAQPFVRLVVGSVNVPTATSAGTSGTSVLITAATRIPLAASASTSAAGAAVTAKTQIPLAASAGTSVAAGTVTAATQVALAAAVGTSTASAAITAKTAIALASSTGTSTASAAITAATQVALAAAAGTSVASATVTNPTQIALAVSAGTSTATNAMTTKTLIALAASTGTSTAAGTISAGNQIPLATSTGTSTAAMGLTAATRAPLAASAGTSAASMALTAASRAALAASTGTSTATGGITAPTKLVLAPAAGTSTAAGAVSSTHPQPVSLLASSSTSSASVRFVVHDSPIRVAAQLSLPMTVQSSRTQPISIQAAQTQPAAIQAVRAGPVTVQAVRAPAISVVAQAE